MIVAQDSPQLSQEHKIDPKCYYCYYYCYYYYYCYDYSLTD